ncbi:serine/threonine-protein kinase [Thermoactinospora rubra]|uniref:serine/threonine-protein kinase n=1 Tax=Thermoactinospora rubra TaxID=1088767 RepID=UPI0019806FAD|nr:serine/threonine-protein kinase [Thermoactinospora rubra]
MNRYELLAPLGRGTMGTVWRAHDRELGREVAIKEVRQDPGLTDEQLGELRERMLREGRIASRINHPAVAAIYDVVVSGGSPWIIMELVEGRSLEEVIEEEGPLPPRLVAELGVDLLGALRAAHAQGITHRDVKPGNVLITEHGRVVLTDFGIAKAEGDSKLTKTGMVIGSPGYTAPERARGEYTGPESDVWSLGATLYFAVEGKPAYERATISETLAALMTENVDPPTQAGPLRPVLEGMLHKNHKQRLTAAKAETMLRMIADTPTHEFAALPAERGRGTAAPDVAETAPAAPRPAKGDEAGDEVSAEGPGPGEKASGDAPSAYPEDDGQDPDRTIVVKRPKPPLPEPQAQKEPPVDEGAMATRVVLPHPPGRQVYPAPDSPSPASPGGVPEAPRTPLAPGPAPAPPYAADHSPGLDGRSERGLGTDLFAIAGREEPPDKPGRTGMLVLMAIAAAAAVVVAILIMAALAS